MKDQPNFDHTEFLAAIGGKKSMGIPKKQVVFTQGDAADSLFYIQTGTVRLTVVSGAGKEAVIGIIGEGEFFGESCILGKSIRPYTATAMTDCSVMRIEKKSMMEVLHREHAFSDMFVAYLLTRNIRYEEDLVDQLFNSSEERLARILLLMAGFGKEGKPGLVCAITGKVGKCPEMCSQNENCTRIGFDQGGNVPMDSAARCMQNKICPKISQEVLAEMIGTTRSRVNFFMKRFEKLGLIERDGTGLHIGSALLNVVLHD